MKAISFISLIVLLSSLSQAKTMEFGQLWEMAQESSPQLKKSSVERQVSETQKERLRWHWTPHLYVQAGYLQTDNAAQSFFANMNQRSVTDSDFNPQTLNNPEDTSLVQTTLGVAWPLYEGGKFQKLEKSSTEMHQAQVYFEKGQNYKVKSDLLAAYSHILTHQQNKKELKDLIAKINSKIENYQLGIRTNPVGYSGLLGLKAILNKANSYLRLSQMQIVQQKNEIHKIIPNLEMTWEAPQKDPLTFINGQVQLTDAEKPSLFLKGHKHITQALHHQAEAEKAVVYPSLGLFAEGSQFSGDRSEDRSYTYGAYLKWNLGWYQKGVYREVSLKKQAQELSMKMQSEQEQAAKNALQSALSSLEENLEDLEKNHKLLNEQLAVSQKLFRSGAINALQMSDLYDHLVDLYWHKVQTLSEFIKMKTQLYLLVSQDGQERKNEKL